MGVFGDLNKEGLEKSEDRLGGFSVLDTALYLGTIKMAFAGQSSGGARSVTLVLDVIMDDSGKTKEYTETVYVTNKQGQNFFLNKQDNTKKVPLPGFTLIDDLCIVTTDKELAQQDGEDKVVKIYDYDAKKELPKTVPMLTELLGKQAYFAIVKEVVDKNEKVGNDYVPTGETREQNTIEKVFHHPTKYTVVEAREKAETAVFADAWEKKNKGVTRQKAKGAADGAAKTGRPGGGPPQAGASAGSTTGSLFKK